MDRGSIDKRHFSSNNAAILPAASARSERDPNGPGLRDSRQLPGHTHISGRTTPGSSSSGRSMSNYNEHITPPGSPHNGHSPDATVGIGRLSLENNRPQAHPSRSAREGRGQINSSPIAATKRSASSELCGPDVRRPATQESYRRGPAGSRHPKATGPRRSRPARQSSYMYSHATGEGNAKSNVFQSTTGSGLNSSSTASRHSYDRYLIQQDRGYSRDPVMIRQPESSPISQEQLAAEVKGIYAGLVMVEAKCINIDAAQANDPQSQLNPEQWQALIALHRTLLYEHHDFLMATQHPSATPALRGLATKYSMPARMWRHGIHSFLEVLRHRRPDSQDYMLAFIYLAYQMMALLFETVPVFTDTWIECLGDLARYRMAIEEEKEAHAIWGGVAGRWYNTASDRHPSIGRLYHHLGILERPSLRKLFLYSKSLTCVLPFPNARDSLATLCGPILQDAQLGHNSYSYAEARILTFHAQVFTAADSTTINCTSSDVLQVLAQQPSEKIGSIGVELIVTNIAFELELGSPNNLLWQSFQRAINKSIQASRPSVAATGTLGVNRSPDELSPLATTTANPSVRKFGLSLFNTLFQISNDPSSLKYTLPSIHIILVWIYGLHTIHSQSFDHNLSDTISPLFDHSFSWGGLSNLLNKLTLIEPIDPHTIECARKRVFLTPPRNDTAAPLSEDLLIRGLVWTQPYFPSGWFDAQTGDDGITIETESMHKARIERVQWLGAYFAFHSEYLLFDVNTKSFAPLSGRRERQNMNTNADGFQSPAALQEGRYGQQPSPPSRSSAAPSDHTDSDGYAVVSSPKPARTWANVAAKPTKTRPENNSITIVDDDDGVQWRV